MRIRLLACALVALAAFTPSLGAQARQAAPPPAKPAATPAPAAATIGPNDIAVTLNYTGKGVIDATHKVMLILFAEPTVGPNSQPVRCCGGPMFVSKNNTTVTFKEVPTKPVYVFAIYDEAGTGYNAQNGPPPNGTPVGMYMKAGTVATPVTPGSKTPIKFSFSGAKKWGQ